MPETLSLTTQQKHYLQDCLDKVSRTFALLPPYLDESFAEMMSTAYLICRVIDNIEDCEQPFPWQQLRFHEVRSLLLEPDCARQVLADWAQERWPGLTADETLMMQPENGLSLWRIYASLPDVYRNIIAEAAAEMASGMEQTLNPDAAPVRLIRQGIAVLVDVQDYNDYCYYVAGTVGNLQTRVMQEYYRLPSDTADRLLTHSQAVGRGLQKTNIIKDFFEDRKRGVCYVPQAWLQEVQESPLRLEGAPPAWTHKVINDALMELEHAVAYIVALPTTGMRGFRKTCLLCLLPAYQTLLLAAERHQSLFTDRHQVKISRLCLAQCLKDMEVLVDDDTRLLKYRDNVHQRFHRCFKGM